jgi:hypothetical protein
MQGIGLVRYACHVHVILTESKQLANMYEAAS